MCDGTGYYEVLNRREVHRLELPQSGARPYKPYEFEKPSTFIPEPVPTALDLDHSRHVAAIVWGGQRKQLINMS